MKLEQAARALLAHWDTPAWKYLKPTGDLMADLREALAEQSEQKPVAWFVQYQNRHEFVFGSKPDFIVDGVVEPLYAAPARTKDLTDDEICGVTGCNKDAPLWLAVSGIARAVIAAYKEKNRG